LTTRCLYVRVNVDIQMIVYIFKARCSISQIIKKLFVLLQMLVVNDLISYTHHAHVILENRRNMWRCHFLKMWRVTI
jgi:hypothetical protein